MDNTERKMTVYVNTTQLQYSSVVAASLFFKKHIIAKIIAL